MGTISASYLTLNPSFIDPDIITQYQQASGAFSTLSGSEINVKLGEGDLYVYMKRMDVRTQIAGGQTAYNQLPSCNIITSMISTPTYLHRVRAEYDHHDTAALARWGASIVDAQRLGMRQAHFQNMRNLLLYGFNPANGEGLLNANGATTVNLPPDANGHQTVVSYDDGEMATFLLKQIVAIKTRTVQLGLPARIVILGPQRVLGKFEYYGVVQLTQFQRIAAGTATTAEMVSMVAGGSGDKIEWVYDDTLIGKGAGGADAIIITMPEVQKPQGAVVNTNEFANLTPSTVACNLMYADMPAPREIPTPLAGGAVDILSEMRVTSGWSVRPETLTIVSMQYE
jgi:hypothetical protein